MKEVNGYTPGKDPRLINCKTECGNERCYARRYGLFAEKTCPNFVEPKPTTKADKLRAMSDEELADVLTDIGVRTLRLHKLPVTEPVIEQATEDWLDWLRQEANDAL